MMTNEFDIAGFQTAVERHWHYHSKCQNLSWAHIQRDDGIFEIEVAPVYQQVFGGRDDGKNIWVGFELHLSEFFGEPGVQVEEFGCVSYCESYSPTPAIPMRGKYLGLPFVLKLLLEPVPGSKPIEVVDTLRSEIRTIRETNLEQSD